MIRDRTDSPDFKRTRLYRHTYTYVRTPYTCNYDRTRDVGTHVGQSIILEVSDQVIESSLDFHVVLTRGNLAKIASNSGINSGVCRLCVCAKVVCVNFTKKKNWAYHRIGSNAFTI